MNFAEKVVTVVGMQPGLVELATALRSIELQEFKERKRQLNCDKEESALAALDILDSIFIERIVERYTERRIYMAQNKLTNIYIDETEVTTSKPLYEDDFLAGEETPVWLADFNYDEANGEKYSFRRLRPKATPMVKKAWDYWNSAKTGSGFPLRKVRINVRGNLTYAEEFHDVLSDARTDHLDSSRRQQKRFAYGTHTVYPSILVVLDYSDVYPTDDNKKLLTVEQLVMYALAFWGTVASSFKNIQNPKVSLRIAGIVITSSRQASPYLSSNKGKKTLVDALSPMLDYWRSVSKKANSDFPIGSYDIVAHMTDLDPYHGLINSWYDLVLLNRGNYAVASVGPPCQLEDKIGGILIQDDFAFNGIHRAIMHMIIAFGGNVESLQNDQRIEWNHGLWNSVGEILKYTTCMAVPKQHHRPGTPVPPILAGELIPSERQCELANYNPDAWTCWDTVLPDKRSNCQTLYCSNQHILGVTCSEAGLTLDGSFCNTQKTKICLAGRCVDKKLHDDNQ